MKSWSVSYTILYKSKNILYKIKFLPYPFCHRVVVFQVYKKTHVPRQKVMPFLDLDLYINTTSVHMQGPQIKHIM